MKKLLFLLFICFFLPSQVTLAQGELIRFGVMNSYPPFVSQDALGNSYGFDIAIAKAICQQMNKVCVFVPMPFSDLFPSLNNHSIDAAISAIVISPKRKELYDFTFPYYLGHMAFLTTMKNNTVATVDGLKGKKAGTIKGSAFLDYLYANYPNTKIKEYSLAADGITALVKGDIDVFLIDYLHAKWWALSGHRQFKLSGPILPLPGNLGYGIAVRKGNTNLLQSLDAALQTIISNGIENQIINLYLKLTLNQSQSLREVDLS